MNRLLVVSNQLAERPASALNPVVHNLSVAFSEAGYAVTNEPVLSLEKGYPAYVRLFARLLILRVRKRDIAFDAVQVHFGGIQALITALVFRRRTVITYHGTDLHGGVMPGGRVAFKAQIGVIASRLAARLAGEVVCVSPSLLPYLPAAVRTRASVIATGVVVQKFSGYQKIPSRRAIGVADDSCYLVLFSDIAGSPVKRRDIADQVVACLQSEGVPARLLLMTGVNHERVPLYLAAADILLIVSDNEGSPNIVKEAIAARLRIASVDVGDVFQYLDAAAGDIALERRDPVYIAAKLRSVLGFVGRAAEEEDSRLARIDMRRAVLEYDRVYTNVIARSKEQ